MDSTAIRPRRTGGRSARVRRAVLEATLVELVESGYGGLSMEAVARRAGVHKTTVYRQWSDRERLLTDALMQVSTAELPLPDTGDLRSDLVALATAIVTQLSQPHVATLIRTLVAEGPRLPALRQTARAFWAARFAQTGGVVWRAIDRGELPPETDAPTVLEALIAPLYLRLLVTGGDLSEEVVARAVDVLLNGILGQRPGAPAHSSGGARRRRSA